jgi:hypothetical protein
MLDDKYITKEGFLVPEGYQRKPTYKVVARHYFRLRLLQSEILQVLQHRQAQQARAIGANQGNEYMHTKLPSPFLANFDSFRSWRLDIDRRLLEWKDSSPSQLEAGVQFSPLFLELNYWQAVIMLYRQSLAVPAGLANELGNTDGNVGSPSVVDAEEREDEEHVFLKVAEAGQKVLKLYRYVKNVPLHEKGQETSCPWPWPSRTPLLLGSASSLPTELVRCDSGVAVHAAVTLELGEGTLILFIV